MLRPMLVLAMAGVPSLAQAAANCAPADVPPGVPAAVAGAPCNPGGVPVCRFLGGPVYDCGLGVAGSTGGGLLHAVNFTGGSVTAWGTTAVGANFCCVETLANIAAFGGSTVSAVGASYNDVISFTWRDPGSGAVWELQGNVGAPIAGVAYGREGNDTINGSAAIPPTYTPNEQLYGDQDADTIFGRAGDDDIFGDDGDDILRGGPGDDYIEGNDGDDQINAGAGVDVAHGDLGDDSVCTDVGGAALTPELLYGEDGDDYLHDPAPAWAVGDGGLHVAGDTCSSTAAPWANCEALIAGAPTCITP